MDGHKSREFPAALELSLAAGKQHLPMTHGEAGTVWTKEAVTHDAYFRPV